jgi:hypothetical protein
MSERTLNNQPGATKPSLDELRVSHGRDSVPANSADLKIPDPKAAAPLDLTQVSMETRSMVRLSARPQKRTVSTATTPHTAVSTKPSKSPAPAQRFGIFNNPRYKYEGGPLGFLIAFVANVLKVLEQLLFRTRTLAPPLRAQVPAATTSTPPVKKKKGEDEDPELPTLSPPRPS